MRFLRRIFIITSNFTRIRSYFNFINLVPSNGRKTDAHHFSFKFSTLQILRLDWEHGQHCPAEDSEGVQGGGQEQGDCWVWGPVGAGKPKFEGKAVNTRGEEHRNTPWNILWWLLHRWFMHGGHACMVRMIVSCQDPTYLLGKPAHWQAELVLTKHNE